MLKWRAVSGRVVGAAKREKSRWSRLQKGEVSTCGLARLYTPAAVRVAEPEDQGLPLVMMDIDGFCFVHAV